MEKISDALLLSVLSMKLYESYYESYAEKRTGIRQTGLLIYISYIAKENRLSLEELRKLIENLRNGSGYSIDYLNFDFVEGHIRTQVHDIQKYNSADTVLKELNDLISSFEHAKQLGVVTYKDLMTYLGSTRNAEKIVLDLLIRTQLIADPEVRDCWRMLEIYNKSFAEDLEECYLYFQRCIDEGEWGQFQPGEDFILKSYGGRIHGSHCDDECSCPKQAFVNELKKLNQRYYDSI